MISKEELSKALTSRHGATLQKKLDSATIGIAGLGGLGSHIAVLLARLGLGNFVLADFDRVNISNIHRQNYFLADIGSYKTDALVATLLQINPYLNYQIHNVKITPENAQNIFSSCDIICEAFDIATEKVILIETLLKHMPHLPIISGNGLAGMGSSNNIHTRHAFKNLYICGDEKSEASEDVCLTAPRVALCAAHQANIVLRLLNGDISP